MIDSAHDMYVILSVNYDYHVWEDFVCITNDYKEWAKRNGVCDTDIVFDPTKEQRNYYSVHETSYYEVYKLDATTGEAMKSAELEESVSMLADIFKNVGRGGVSFDEQSATKYSILLESVLKELKKR